MVVGKQRSTAEKKNRRTAQNIWPSKKFQPIKNLKGNAFQLQRI
jgi:hypothetical protein